MTVLTKKTQRLLFESLAKNFLFFALLILTPLLMKAQNLIVNGNFEIHPSPCIWPWNQDINELSPPWFSPNNGSPDYFNRCYSNPCSFRVPDNFFGFMETATFGSDGYAGTIVGND